MFSMVNIRTGLGLVLSLFKAKDRWTSPFIEARTVPTLLARSRRSSDPSGRTDGGIGKGTIENRHRVGAGRKDIRSISYASRVHDTRRRGPASDR